jgi:hypothetical protein
MFLLKQESAAKQRALFRCSFHGRCLETALHATIIIIIICKSEAQLSHKSV